MPALSITIASERVAQIVEQATSPALDEIFSELFPERSVPDVLSASDLAHHIRNEIEVEEIVDLWNVVFPADHDVWYNEETQELHFNEELIGHAD